MQKPETLFPLPEPHPLLDGDLHRCVITEALAAGLKIYVVGGYLRDLALWQIYPKIEHVSKDLDYAIAGGSAFSFAKKMAAVLGGHFVALDEKNDTARVVMPDGMIFDFAGCQGGSIEQDILRRDFTINSLYIDPAKPDIIVDCVGGIDDIKSGTIRSLHLSILESDPVRLLRAFRFAGSWGFNIETHTLNWIKTKAQSISGIAGERISAELFLMFSLPSTKTILPVMAETGLLEAMFSELRETRAVTNNSHHHLNLFDHSLEAVFQCEDEYAPNPSWQDTNLQEEISFGVSRVAACKIAALLHDIGKPATWVITEAGKHTFIGHEKLGASMIADIAKRLRWSKPVERFITKLVHFHLRPGQLFHHQEPTKQAINRLFRQSGTDFPALILLAQGDLGATKGPAMVGEKSVSLQQNFYRLLAKFYEFSEAAKTMEKLLDGQDVMKMLDLGPGKEIGEILLALKEAQELKKVVNRLQAEDFVRSLHKKGLSRD